MAKILVVNDEVRIRELLDKALANKGYQVVLFRAVSRHWPVPLRAF